MFGGVRWLLAAAIVVSPVTVDLGRGVNWSVASAQYVPCDPVVVKYFSSDRFVGSVVRFRTPPPACGAPACILRGACVSEIRLDYGLLQQNKLNPNGCLLRVCTSRPASWFGR